jgi:hypothetical protein
VLDIIAALISEIGVYGMNDAIQWLIAIGHEFICSR